MGSLKEVIEKLDEILDNIDPESHIEFDIWHINDWVIKKSQEIIGSSELMVDAKERFDYYKRLNKVRIKEIGLVQPETHYHYNEKHHDLLIQRKIDGDILQRDNEVVSQLKKLYEEKVRLAGIPPNKLKLLARNIIKDSNGIMWLVDLN